MASLLVARERVHPPHYFSESQKSEVSLLSAEDACMSSSSPSFPSQGTGEGERRGYSSIQSPYQAAQQPRALRCHIFTAYIIL